MKVTWQLKKISNFIERDNFVFCIFVCDIVQSVAFPCVSGVVKYKVSVQGAASTTLKVTLIDKDGRSVASSSEPSGVLKVVDVKLWWPYLMHDNPGYLYSLEVRQYVALHVKVICKSLVTK